MSIISLVLVLFAATAALRLVADRYKVPLPALLVLGGSALALTPHLPRPAIQPEVIFLLFVPPLLYWAALTSSVRDLRRNARPIVLLGVWLVIATIAIVAVTAHALRPGLAWPMCFLLGAIVSPPDAVAVTAVTRQLRLPQTLLVVLEGESLINDATALVAFQMALSAVLTGQFSLTQAAWRLPLTAFGGIAIGRIIGMVIGWLRQRIGQSSTVENTLSLLTPFIAYLPADWLGLSGVLSVVAAGLYLGRRAPRAVSAETRLQANGMWEIVTFLLEGLIFIFIGLTLPEVVSALPPGTLRKLVWQSCLIGGAMIALRMVWVFAFAYLLPRKPSNPAPSWRSLLFAGWAGIRGGDSLVIALAIPLMDSHGADLAHRPEVIFITFMIILLTLVVQGLTLAPAIRWLGLHGGNELQVEEKTARTASLQAAIDALATTAEDKDIDPGMARQISQRLQHRLDRLQQQGATKSPAATAELGPSVTEAQADSLPSHVRLLRAIIAAQRDALVDLRDRGQIGDHVLRHVQAELDHEEVLLHRRYE